MKSSCKGCIGTAPTHTCESYDPEAARRGAVMVMRAATTRGGGMCFWGHGSDMLSLCWSYGGFILLADEDAIDIERQTARLILRGLLLPQLLEEARRVNHVDYLRTLARLEAER